MDYDADQLCNAIERALAAQDEDCEPAFYAVSGSHLYGFPSEANSDVDVRGFHVADWRRYLTLDEPVEQVVVNQDGTTAGFEDVAEVDLVSYELQKFGQLVVQANFNVLEVVCCAEPILNERPEAIAELRESIESHLPMHVPQTYVGMARTNYEALPARDAAMQPEAKALLYALRGLLAATYVQRECELEADVRTLAEAVLGETILVDDLIAAKRTDEGERVDADLAERARERIEALFEDTDVTESRAPPAYREAVNDWLLRTRGLDVV